MSLYTEKLKSPSRDYRITKFTKVMRCKNQYLKSVAVLCTSNKLTKKKIIKTVLFTIATKRIKHLGLSLSKDETLKMKIIKPLMKEFEDTKSVKSFNLHGLEALILLKCPCF